MKKVRAKKHLGQHFLNDEVIAADIATALKPEGKYRYTLEIGPGMGVLTRFLKERKDIDLYLVEIDEESVNYLRQHFPELKDRIISRDFLQIDLKTITPEPLGLIGNFPYNISSQILFKAFENRDQVLEVTGMFQKEVAVRVTSGPGTRDYGILSVLMQAFYSGEYLFTVPEHVFTPPPKVKSGVIRFVRNEVKALPCDEAIFIKVVKAAFNQRRKTLRNALSGLLPTGTESPLLSQRAERLGVEEFITLTRLVEKS